MFKTILDCVHIVLTVIGFVNILLKFTVPRKSKRTGYQICLNSLYIYIYLICGTLKLINCLPFYFVISLFIIPLLLQ